MSHPTGVRGLKFIWRTRRREPEEVAPHWGAWIEITKYNARHMPTFVAPHWGAWIEMSMLSKHCCPDAHVAPHWGAWIEIYDGKETVPTKAVRRTLFCFNVCSTGSAVFFRSVG